MKPHIAAYLLCVSLLLAGTGLSRPEALAIEESRYYRCTREPVLVDAMRLLRNTRAVSTVDMLLEQQVRILFKDMRVFGPAYAGHDALSFITDDGRQVIYINIRHQQAPAAALAALISHEAMHADRDNSLAEEVAAWQQEAETWQELLQQFPKLSEIKTGTIALVDRENAILVLQTQNRLEQEISSNIAYRGLPQRSPGF